MKLRYRLIKLRRRRCQPFEQRNVDRMDQRTTDRPIDVLSTVVRPIRRSSVSETVVKIR